MHTAFYFSRSFEELKKEIILVCPNYLPVKHHWLCRLYKIENVYYLDTAVFDILAKGESYETCHQKFSQSVNEAMGRYQKEHNEITPAMALLKKEIEDIRPGKVIIYGDGRYKIIQENFWAGLNQKWFRFHI